MFFNKRFYGARVVFFLVSLFNTLQSSNKIIYLISPPRSLSTVFLRALHARGDMVIYNEPCEYCFLLQHKSYAIEIGDKEQPFKTYDQVKKELIRAVQKQNIFIKDTSYAAYECFYEDDLFLTNPIIEFCFLIRDPHASLISFHRVMDADNFNDFDWINERIVYERHYALFEKITKLRGRAPIVISSEELTSDPQKIMKSFCEQVNIDFKETMVAWPSLEHTFKPLDWNDYTTLESCMLWHKNAINSTCFIPCERSYALDVQGQPTFTELKEVHRRTVKEIYAYYMNIYTKMYKYKVY